MFEQPTVSPSAPISARVRELVTTQCGGRSRQNQLESGRDYPQRGFHPPRPRKVQIEGPSEGWQRRRNRPSSRCVTRGAFSITSSTRPVCVHAAIATGGFRRMAAAPIGPVAEGNRVPPGGAGHVRFARKPWVLRDLVPAVPLPPERPDRYTSPETVTDADLATASARAGPCRTAWPPCRRRTTSPIGPPRTSSTGDAAAGLAPEEPRLNNDPRGRDLRAAPRIRCLRRRARPPGSVPWVMLS